MQLCDLVSDAEIERVHGKARFGEGISKREVVKFGLLKCASGYHQGHTSKVICQEHGLIDEKYCLTEKGKKYLWEAFGKESNF